MSELKRTSLYDRHVALGARMVPFGGWVMPVEYQGILAEHRAVREGAGVFDVSHMGEIEISGGGAKGFARTLLANDVSVLGEGNMLYSVMCQEDGGIIDDLMAYALAPESYLLVVNAATKDEDWSWISGLASSFDGCEVRDASDDFGLLAVQGPRAEDLVQPLVDRPLTGLGFMAHAAMRFSGMEARISRSGYTGEDGFEIMVSVSDLPAAWDAVIAAGAAPIGLGARDTLRLEAGLRLYGNDMDRGTTPYEAGLGWTVKPGGGRRFIGEEALRDQKEKGIPRRLVGLVLRTKGVPRAHQKILSEGKEIGETTSGSFSPTRGEGIAMGYVLPEYRKAGTRVEIESRNRRLPADVVKLPFVPMKVKVERQGKGGPRP